MPEIDPVPTESRQLLANIPTSDPQAALQFCQQLAALLDQARLEALSSRLEASSSRLEASSSRLEASTPEASSSRLEASTPGVSVVIPVYNEQENLPILYERLTTVLKSAEPDYEIVFVDDGSRDRSLELLHGMENSDPHVCVVELARNFGHQVAISAGLDHARGRGVIIMDADLQDPPEVIPQFIAKWREGHDVVYAIREQRKENWFKRTAYAVFYRLLQRIANIRIPLDAGDFCIMDRRVVDVLVEMPERNRFVRGIRSWIGLDQVGLAYERQARYAGRPKFTFSRLLYLALDGLVSFSYVPLRMITMVGFGVSLLSILLAIYYLIK
jgi:glycosyltransferase involved in cell wall biosynthesis